MTNSRLPPLPMENQKRILEQALITIQGICAVPCPSVQQIQMVATRALMAIDRPSPVKVQAVPLIEKKSG